MDIILEDSTEFNNLSNYSNHTISYELEFGRWPSISHYYQAMKFLHEKSKVDIIDRIRHAESPLIAEQLGAKRYPESQNWFQRTFKAKSFYKINDEWKSLKLGFMEKALKAKIIEHEDVRNTLISTGNKNLILRSDNQFWGIDNDNQGQNEFGKLLMKLRAIYLEKGNLVEQMLPPWVVYPEYDRVSSAWRQGDGEEYLWNYTSWFVGLSITEKKEYINRFPANGDWKDFYKTYVTAQNNM